MNVVEPNKPKERELEKTDDPDAKLRMAVLAAAVKRHSGRTILTNETGSV